MPYQVEAIETEKLQGAGVYDLDPNTRILARQAGKLLGRSKTRMDSDRRDGKDPKATKDGGKVWYPLGRVLSERARQDGMTLDEAREAARQRVRTGGRDFSAFLASGQLDERWPVATVRGCPVDFFAALGAVENDEDLGEIEDLTLEEFLTLRLAIARAEAT